MYLFSKWFLTHLYPGVNMIIPSQTLILAVLSCKECPSPSLLIPFEKECVILLANNYIFSKLCHE